MHRARAGLRISDRWGGEQRCVWPPARARRAIGGWPAGIRPDHEFRKPDLQWQGDRRGDRITGQPWDFGLSRPG